MICKYCNHQYEGDRCSSCGKMIPLTKRSTELDTLMGRGTASDRDPSSIFGAVTVNKTMAQRLSAEYQRGLKEGYDNGFQDGNKNSSVQHQPSLRIGKALVICCAVAIISAIGGGFIGRSLGYNSGHSNGIIQARSTYEPRITVLEQQHQTDVESQRVLETKIVSARREGYDEAVRELLTPTGTLTTPVPNKKNGAIENTQAPIEILQKPNLPYSLARNEGEYDPYVEKIQIRLNELGVRVKGEALTPDGVYGHKTESAVKAYQKSIPELRVTGVVDRETYIQLFPDEGMIYDESITSDTDEEESQSQMSQLPLGTKDVLLDEYNSTPTPSLFQEPAATPFSFADDTSEDNHSNDTIENIIDGGLDVTETNDETMLKLEDKSEPETIV